MEIREKGSRLTSQQMTLKVLGVQVGFVAVRTRKFPFSILGRDGGVFGRAIDTVGHWGSATRDAGEDTATTLRTDDLGTRGILGSVGRTTTIGTGHRVRVHPG